MGRNDREIKREAVMNWEENAREFGCSRWEGEGWIVTLNGAPIGQEVSKRDARIITKWLPTADKEIAPTAYQEGAGDMREKARVTCRSGMMSDKLPDCAEVTSKTSHNGTKGQHLDASVDNSDQMKVVRYERVSYSAQSGGAMRELKNGSYVRYSDYEALAARVQELEKERVKILGEGDTLHYENTRLREALKEYGHHKPHCKLDPCDCGILAAVSEQP